LLTAGLTALVVVAAALTVDALIASIVVDHTYVAALAVGVAIGSGYSFGASAVIAHYVVRALLAHSGCSPWRYVGFLNFAAERVLLRRVGGAVEFIRPTLRDHLAA
jgi:hypothetical protein